MFPETKAPRSRLTDKIEIKSNEDGSVKFLALGVPYGGPDYLGGKDFHGERFTDQTLFGDHTGVKTVYATLDHAVALKENGKTILSPIKMLIGSAEFVKSDEMGRWYEISIAEGEQYNEIIDLLKDLESKKMLRASSQAIPTTVTKSDDGHIDSWVVGEIAFTTHAANPLAVVELMKNHHFDTAALEAFIKEAKDISSDLEENEDVEDTGEDVPAEDNESEVPLDEFVESTFSEEEDAPADEEESDADVDDAAKSTDVLARLSAMEDTLKAISESKIWAYLDASISFQEEEVPKLFQLLSELASDVKSVDTRTNNVEKGLRTFAEVLSKRLSLKVQAEAEALSKKSAPERQAMSQKLDTDIRQYMDTMYESHQASNQFPNNAPGGN